MAAAVPTPLSIISAAMRRLGALGKGESSPDGDDQLVMLEEFNGLMGLLNSRGKTAWYVQNQAFTFTSSLQSYTIGNTADSPNFVVTSGGRPRRIEQAQLVLTDETPDVLLPVAVWNWPEYTQLSIPALSAQWPFGIYYEPSYPNGVIYPYPAFPTETSNQLKLWWWIQLLRFGIDDITTALTALPDGYDTMIADQLAVRAYSIFPKRSDYDTLMVAARQSYNTMTAQNQPPPKISTNDGMSQTGSSFSWRSRQWV